MFEFNPSRQILYEDNHVIVINKFPTQIIQGDKTGDKPLSEYLKEYLKVKYNKPGNVFLGVVHRIDRPSSGLVIFARTSKALTRLNQMLRENQISKTYWIVVDKLPPADEGTLDNYLWKLEMKNKSFVVDEKKKGAKRAILSYSLKQSMGGKHLLEVTLKTGRHHQIRVQFAHIGCPVKGDVKYGSGKANEDQSICLHARKLSFVHPVGGREINLISDFPPGAVWNLFRSS